MTQKSQLQPSSSFQGYHSGFTSARQYHTEQTILPPVKKSTTIKTPNVKMENFPIEPKNPEGNSENKIELDSKQISISQQEINKPLMIVAGPGSGKTATLCARVEYLINSDVDPDKILVVTFSNKAAVELKERLEKIINSNEKMKNSNKKPWISTFHSFCYQLIKRFFKKAGFNSWPAVCSSKSEELGLLKAGMLEINSEKLLKCYGTFFKKNKIKFPDVSFLSSPPTTIGNGTTSFRDTHFSINALNEDPSVLKAKWDKVDSCVLANKDKLGIEATSYELIYNRRPQKTSSKQNAAKIERKTKDLAFKLRYDDYTTFNKSAPKDIKIINKKNEESLLKHIHKSRATNKKASDYIGEYREAIEAYSWAKKRYNILDFDDMLELGNFLLEQPGIREKVRSEFQYMLVDEFQDLNTIQMDILMKLQNERGWLTVVGDERQSIYGFRGATPMSNFQTFMESFVDSKLKGDEFPDLFKKQTVTKKVKYNNKQINVDLTPSTIPNYQISRNNHIEIIISDDDESITDLGEFCTKQEITDDKDIFQNAIVKNQSLYGRGNYDLESDIKPRIINHDTDIFGSSPKKALGGDHSLNSFQTLNTNYRSNALIVELGNIIMKSSKSQNELIKRLRVNLYPAQNDPVNEYSSAHLWRFKTHSSEAEHIANQVETLINDCNYLPGDIAILLRSFRFSNRNLTQYIQKTLTQKGIQFVVRGGKSLLSYNLWITLSLFMRCINNPRDSMAIKNSLLKLVPGVGEVTISKIESLEAEDAVNSKSGKSLGSPYGSTDNRELFFEEKIRIAMGLTEFSKRIRDKLSAFIDAIEKARSLIGEVSLFNFATFVNSTISGMLDGISNESKKGNKKESDTYPSDFMGSKANVANSKVEEESEEPSSEVYLQPILEGFSDLLFIENTKPINLSDVMIASDINEYSERVSNNKMDKDTNKSPKESKNEKRNVGGKDVEGSLGGGSSTKKIDCYSTATSEVIHSFIAYLSMISDTSLDTKKTRVIISTIHQAKGLEWPVVFLPIFCDGVIPSHPRSDNLDRVNGTYVLDSKNKKTMNEKADHFEDELRLAYVAITRAKQLLYISSSEKLRELGIEAEIYDFNDVEDDSAYGQFPLSRFIPKKLRMGGKIGDCGILKYQKL
ncbi:hypothetical protein BB558_004595 [Smittium angustum]|uniref:DNA 3'-5' helicase n=1 Tax=Smittium angustum TaxID=133377 RepID=A0A2U1J2T7_SMIAN|nr:hypothetical protein BB558_004595 [Smittium angustum]